MKKKIETILFLGTSLIQQKSILSAKRNGFKIVGVDKNKKVVGMHILDGPIISKSKPNLVVIMAGGKGKRLRPLTNNTPKPMLKIGKKPILQTIIEKFKENKFKKFLICVNFNSKIIKNYFGNGKTA